MNFYTSIVLVDFASLSFTTRKIRGAFTVAETSAVVCSSAGAVVVGIFSVLRATLTITLVLESVVTFDFAGLVEVDFLVLLDSALSTLSDFLVDFLLDFEPVFSTDSVLFGAFAFVAGFDSWCELASAVFVVANSDAFISVSGYGDLWRS